eukprot:417243_1
MAVAYYNDSIYLLGGMPTTNRQQLLQFNINHNVLNDSGTLSIQMLESYTQMDNLVYFISSDWSTISTYDLQSKALSSNWRAIPTYAAAPCMASTDEYLFIIGGSDASGSALNMLQIYDLSPMGGWKTNNLVMNQSRNDRFACVIHPTTNFLYAIGGNNLKTIEKLSVGVTNIENEIEGWNTIEDQLTVPSNLISGVVYLDKILIIGGYYQNHTSSVMHIIDVISDGVSIHGVPLAYPVSRTAVIIVDHRLYAFGGSGNGGHNIWIDTWQYFDLPPTQSPTHAPTESTLSPTDGPTKSTPSPSHGPTESSQSPTFAPTDSTLSPSNAPTELTMFPTDAPTEPTLSPTHAPTQFTSSPTDAPTDQTSWPTTAPSQSTLSPSESPTESTLSPTGAPTTLTLSPSGAPTASTSIPTQVPTNSPIDVYCEQCPDGTVGSYGKCNVKCGMMEEPNDIRTECEFYHPWWLYLLEGVGSLTFITGIGVCVYRGFVKKHMDRELVGTEDAEFEVVWEKPNTETFCRIEDGNL